MAETGVGNLAFIETTMDRRQYLNILKDNLRPSVRKLQLGHGWTFQQDIDPKHTALQIRERILYKTITTTCQNNYIHFLNPRI